MKSDRESDRESRAAIEGPYKQLRQIACLVIALNRRKHEFNRPLRPQPARFQRIREAQSTNGKIRMLRFTARELLFDVLSFAQHRAGRQQRKFGIRKEPIEIRRADLHQRHATLA